MADEIKGKGKKKRQGRYSSLKQLLEPRMLFDAALVSPPSDPTSTADASDQTQSGASGSRDGLVPPDRAQQPVATPSTQTDSSKATTDRDTGVIATDGQSSNPLTADKSVNLQEFTQFQPPEPKELVFIDSRIANPQLLLDGISANAEIHYVSADFDGIFAHRVYSHYFTWR
jgi:hypothetical protein